MDAFEMLNGLNINGHTEEKDVGGKKLTYLSWPWAWAEVKKRYPDAHYTIWKNENGAPYTEDPLTGYMVYTNVTIEGITHEMWLPVMDGANRAMKRIDYDYRVKNPKFKYAKWNEQKKGYFDNYGNEQPEYLMKHCEAATMMDINKTIMRCLVKNLAMFGLGLYIYAGEDLPETEKEEKQNDGNAAPAPAPVQNQQKTGPVQVTESVKVPEIQQQQPPVEVPKKPGLNETMVFLTKQMKELRVARGITPKKNNELFAEQRKVLVKNGLAPDKDVNQYTMEEARQLIQDMVERFPLDSAELRQA